MFNVTRHYEDVLDWIIRNQFSRRNSPDGKKAYLRGLQYEREKKKRGGNGSNQHKSKTETSADLHKTAEQIAQQHNVSERTIRDDAHFANAVDSIAKNLGNDAKTKNVG